jgi:adenylylsulfate kinase
MVIWFTGLSGSGKTTVALEYQKLLNRHRSFILDGDVLRNGLCSDLGFSLEDRSENIRRVGYVSRLIYDLGYTVLATFITPLEKDRLWLRGLYRPGQFWLVYIKCSLSECGKRDPKGLYEKAYAGEIANFTGVDSPYEEPKSADIVLDTEDLTSEECAEIIYDVMWC